MTLHAWVDESMTTAVTPNTPEPFYILAAAVADPDDCDGTRSQLRDLLPRGRDRLHWRDEAEPLRRKVSSAVSSCAVSSIVVIAVPLDRARQERARRLCMERLFYELEHMQVSHIWLETRTQSLNAKDMKMVDVLRSRGMIPNLRVDLELPTREPMLWVPDAVAGAITAARKGVTTHRRTLGDLIREIQIELT